MGNNKGLVKIGLLYLHKGNWNGEQVLDESWVNTQQTTNTQGEYGAILAECWRKFP
jgi:hypothetical protein